MNGLNENHRRHILTYFRSIDQDLSALEAAAVKAEERSAFSPFVDDMSPAEKRVARSYFERIREEMALALDDLDIPLAPNPTSLRWRMRTMLVMVKIALAEIGPNYLLGYGALDPATAETVRQRQANLQRLLDELDSYLVADEPEEDAVSTSGGSSDAREPTDRSHRAIKTEHGA